MKFAVLAAIVTGMSAVSTTLASSADTSLTATGTDSACSAASGDCYTLSNKANCTDFLGSGCTISKRLEICTA
ncbi:hypothetical protein B0H13DRAFT_2323785 [Mycena leptocephala]|nr:hypothetical protein B0H13DRAFT_2323785 [Mycena leptocephala]